MTLPSLENFVSAALASRLIDRQLLGQRLEEFRAGPHSTDRSVKGFAKYLVARREVTVYQAERLLAGRTEGFFLGELKILDRLGAGGMGKVYLAEQLKLGRQVAVKVLLEDRAGDPEYVARFQREARAAAQLKHPNIVQIYDVGQQGRTHYIVMELVRGKNLSTLLRERGAFSVDQAIDAIQQTAKGLEHAHEHGIVHRDIKPSNLVWEGETVKILDLGLARRFDAGETLTQEAKGLGTPDYMSPEQCRDARRADARSDIYSLGCTWYALLAGRPPFAEGEPIAKALAHQMREPEPIQNLAGGVPDWMARAIHKMLAKLPEERYQSCAELLAEIEDHCSRAPTPRVATTVARVPAGASAKQLPSPPSLEPAHAADSDTLIEGRSTTVPIVLVYLLPVMGALVLGGVYFGVRFLREQLGEAEPVIVEVKPPPPATEQTPPDRKPVAPGEPALESRDNPPPAERKAAQSQQPERTQPKASGPGAGEAVRAGEEPGKKDAPPVEADKGAEPAPPPPTPTKVEAPVAEKRAASVWRVGTGEGMLRDLASAWEQSRDGDRIEVAQPAPLRVGPLESSHKTVSLLGALKGRERPTIVLELPPEPLAGRGLWRVASGRLEVQGIDFYVDVAKARAPNSELVLFDLMEADLRLIDSSITVISGPAEGRTPVTAVRCRGERPWDAKARGDPPAKIEVQLRNCMIRGAWTAVYLDSRQAALRMENSVVCSPGALLHVFHTRPLEFAHHRLDLEVGACTFELGGALALIDCRPFDLAAVPLEARVRSTIVVGPSAVTPPQVLWQSPVDRERVSAAVRWMGDSNCYVQRGDALQAKSATGPVVTFVHVPADWQRLGFGEDRSWVVTKAFRVLTGPWDRRSASDYSLYSVQARAAARSMGNLDAQVGADTKRVAEPRRLYKR